MTYLETTNMENDTAHLEPAKEKADEPLPRTTCSALVDGEEFEFIGDFGKPETCPSCGSPAIRGAYQERMGHWIHGYECGSTWKEVALWAYVLSPPNA